MSKISNSIIIPESFCESHFYQKGDRVDLNRLIDGNLSDIWDQGFFLHDISWTVTQQAEVVDKFTGMIPWNEPSRVKTEVMSSWINEGLPILTELFRERDRKGACPFMLKYIAIYIQANHWIQGKPVEGVGNSFIVEWKYNPVNFNERLSFILDSPDHHHSFTTLKQLYEESNKKWALYLMK